MPAPSPVFSSQPHAVIEILQHRERLLDDLAGLFTFDIDNKPNAAGVVFKLRIVEALLRR